MLRRGSGSDDSAAENDQQQQFSSTGALNGGNLDCIAPDPSFNPDNVASLLGSLPAGSFAMSLVEVATAEGTGTPAERVATLLEKRVEEVRAQLDGSDLA